MPNATAIIAKPVSQLANFAARLFTPPSDTIRGIENDAWYSPLQPMKPMGPVDAEPKAYQFYSGQNLIFTPRPDAEYSAWELKDLATYPLARICIENVKDAISRIPWTVQLKRELGETKAEHAKRGKGNKDILKIARFWERPDREHCWDDWLRPLIEDMLVIDAASILVRKTFSGTVAELAVLPGEMITRYVDKNGFTPLPPDPAYAQIWWGIPLVNLTTDQLIYRPRNIVRRASLSSQLYGMSPTEQLALEIIPGRKRLEFVTNYYTTGSVPDVVQVVPRGVPVDKIAEAMQWMNSELAGNLAARRQWRMVQGFAEDKDDQILFPKEKLLADAFDEMHIRKICFGYGTSPQRLMRMMGTRNADAQQEASELEGLIPFLDWLKNIRNYITQVTFGLTEVESVYDSSREPDPEKQATSLKTLVGSALLTPNQARERLGEEPDDAEEADMLGVITAAGFVPLSAENKLAQQQVLGTDAESQAKRAADAAAAAKPKPGTPAAATTSAVGKPNGSGAATKPNGKTVHAHFASVLDSPTLERGLAATIVRPTIDPTALTPVGHVAKRHMETLVHNAFSKMSRVTVRELKKRLVKAKRKEQAITDSLMNALADEWEALAASAEDELLSATLGGVSQGSIQISLTSEEALSAVNATASDWARRRAAELVGMRRTAAGELITNPDAKWAITDSTRDMLNIVVRDLFAEEAPTLKDIEARVEQSGIYSDTRASMIARTEVSRAQAEGNLEAWRGSGKVATVNWQLSSGHDIDDECNGYALNSPYPVDAVPDLPAHPNCDCVIVLGEFTDEVEE